jgi:hypothetical protein
MGLIFSVALRLTLIQSFAYCVKMVRCSMAIKSILNGRNI